MSDKVLQTLENIELDILSDIDDSEILQFIIESLKHETKTPYSVLTQALLHYNLPEEEARRVWEDILIIKMEMEFLLKRKISIKTAMVDYYTRKRPDEKIVVFIKDNMITAFDSALRDSLTGLLSHAVIHAELEKEFQAAKRYNLDLSVLFVDIDDFKSFNDSFGHAVGDRVLTLVSSILVNNLRMTDKIGRYGGEEFLVILPHTSRKNAMKIAEKLVSSIREDTEGKKDIPQGITVSIGVAEFSDHYTDGHDLIKNADLSMYRAKKKGKNRVCCFD